MGICPSLSPEERVIHKKNAQIKNYILQQTKDLSAYKFSSPLRKTIRNMANRYLLNEGILEDIDKLLFMTRQGISLGNQTNSFSNFEQQVKNSCLILEDEAISKNKNKSGIEQFKESITDSFQNQMDRHQSLVVQINIIYQNQFDQKKYRRSLQFFLKWASIFQQHSYGGFLKPLYRQFCQTLYRSSEKQLDVILDQTRIFVLFMVSILTNIYQLKQLNASLNGDLFKNENIFNLVMSFLFKRTKIRKFVKILIKQSEEQKINDFARKLQKFHTKGPQFFGVPKKFCLGKQQIESVNYSSEMDPMEKERAFNSCIKMIEQLCMQNQTPITKLKIIVAISKQIMVEINKYYKEEKKEVPEVDPDSIMSIIIYIIAKANIPSIYEELKLVEYFTTTNCLNSISGFYLNTFNAAIQSLLSL